jgi:peptidoglycan hydrolase CwlO-like protein
MMTKDKTILALTSASIALAFFANPSFANDSSQQIAAVSQEIQSLQAQLNAANNKIEKLCDCSITKNTIDQASKSEVHRTANGRGR